VGRLEASRRECNAKQLKHTLGVSNWRSIYLLSEKPAYEELEQRIRVLEKESLKYAQTKNRLSETLQRLNFHIKNAPLAVVEFNNHFQVTYWSNQAEKIFGWTAEEVMGKRIDQLRWVYNDDLHHVAELSAEMLAARRTSNVHINRNYRKDGSVITCEWYNSVLLNMEGKLVSIQSLARDITEERRLEADLKATNVKLEEALAEIKETAETLARAFDEIKRLKDQLEAENIYLRDEMELREGSREIIGTSDAIESTIRKAKQVSRMKTTVLLTGETGTGKGIFARFLHRESDRRDKPFVNVNCASLPANLIESELFGSEKGAFTSSTARQIGRFELANKGTIFLDEIGELPIELQAKLLKVIEEGEFEHLGSPHPIKVDVRIIASTNRDLQEEIKRGRFRQDLYFRINVFPIPIPPLRERDGDIPLFVKAYVKKFNKSHNKDIKRVSTKIMESFKSYAWPGNVRELINVVERAVIVSEGSDLKLAEKIDAMPINSVRVNEPSSAGSRETKALAEAEREHILKALLQTGWRIEGPQGAAQILDLHPNTLRARMKKLGIKRPGRP
jgi:formate hydrogenlyase transcriptional activator